MTRVGLIVNPVAGIGGVAGLKGSDGTQTQHLAISRGAQLRAAARARDALRVLARTFPDAEVLTAGGALGEDVVTAAGLHPVVVARSPRHSGMSPSVGPATTAADTVRAARALRGSGAELLVFAGGDGTARDVYDAVGDTVPVLGVPAGVKMYSGCFAVSPAVAGTLMADLLARKSLSYQPTEVLDIDEDAIRAGGADPVLHGLLLAPAVAGRTQSRKTAAPASESSAVQRAAAGVAELLRPGVRYLLGPGGTTAELARQLGVLNTPLGCDVIEGGRLVYADADEATLLDAVVGQPCQVIVTAIGGQGFVLGRGNQQLSPRVLREIGARPLVVVATDDKLTRLGGRPMLVDTGDPALDQDLSGYVRVITGPGTSSLYPLQAPERSTELIGANLCA